VAPTDAARVLDFEAIQQGDRVVLSRRITEEDVAAFAALSGDYNPLHMETSYAKRTHLRRRVVHGMLVASLVSTLIGMQLPGAGSLWMQQSYRWRHPVFIGDTIEVALRVVHKSAGTRTLTIEIIAMNQNGTTVMDGEGTVSVPEARGTTLEDTATAARVAFVSGGSRGIGAAIAQALAKNGIAVIVNHRNSAAAAEELCHAIADAGGRAIPSRADVRDADAVARAAASLGRPVDILINCAGGTVSPRPFLESDWDEVQRALDVHLKGAWNCCKAVAPGMVQRRAGCIINLGSIITWNTPLPQWGSYSVAKAALKALTRSLAVELGPSGVRVNMISPGTTETEANLAIPERLRKLQAMQTPLRRLAAPEDIARTAAFLCSEAAQFITGADIPVCGGVAM
jgi:3-oxoacyl-[acyl-carrier protein] reductase